MLSLLIVISLRLLDYANVVTRQKLILLKIGLIILTLAPIIFYLLRLFSWQNIQIMLPGQFINQLSIPTTFVTLTESQFNGSFYILMMYGVGFFIMLTRILFSYLHARKQLSTSISVIIQGQSVFLNKHIQSPLSFGLLTAKMYFPLEAEQTWTPREIEMCLAHEKIHVAQNDSFWKLLSLIVQALLFFVPWSYSLHRRVELEMEIVCDEKTCIETEADFREYGGLLLAMSYAQPQNFIFTNMKDSTIKRRLLAMKSTNTHRPLLISILSATLLLAGSTAIAMTSGIADKKHIFKITSKLFIDGKLVSSPRIVAYENQKALIVITDKSGSQGLRMELVARNITRLGKNDAIEINYDIESKNGKEKMHSRPTIVVASDQENRINLSSNRGHSYEMVVVADRESL